MIAIAGKKSEVAERFRTFVTVVAAVKRISEHDVITKTQWADIELTLAAAKERGWLP